MVKRKRNEALEEQYRLQGSCCYYCKERVPYDLITRDHFHPISKGNTLVNNKIFACRPCNNMKGNLNVEEFRSAMIKKCYKILSKAEEQDWDLSEEFINRLDHHVRVVKNLTDIIKKGSKPEIIFT